MTLEQLRVLLACEDYAADADRIDPGLTYGDLRGLVRDVEEREARLAAAVDEQQARVARLGGMIGNARAALTMEQLTT